MYLIDYQTFFIRIPRLLNIPSSASVILCYTGIHPSHQIRAHRLQAGSTNEEHYMLVNGKIQIINIIIERQLCIFPDPS